jgi:hypothetical protein
LQKPKLHIFGVGQVMTHVVPLQQAPLHEKPIPHATPHLPPAQA